MQCNQLLLGDVAVEQGSTGWYFDEDVPGKLGWLMDATRCVDEATSISRCQDASSSLIFRLPRPQQHGRPTTVAVVALELEYLLCRKPPQLITLAYSGTSVFVSVFVNNSQFRANGDSPSTAIVNVHPC